MFDQLSLLVMLLTPVIAYVAGAIVFSCVSRLYKEAALTSYHCHVFPCRNGH
ncbi:hypothetical protein [Paraglaciecola sp. 2405UD69-4]|uniref:hypothetical protein n=1 Tax=Paraglaciecola sp. 2405UD69-4 TaxID=3391836 RepID=UPI0039C97D1F